MDNDNRKHTKVGLIGTLLLHGVILLILWLAFIRAAVPQEESGVPVMLGTELLAKGGGQYNMTEVKVRPVSKPIPAQPKTNPSPVGEKIISQDLEETVAIETKKEKPKKEEIAPEQPVDTPEEQPVEQPKEKTEAELKAEAEKAAAEAAAKSMAGAFGKGNAMKDKGEADAGEGVQGSVEGSMEVGQHVGTDGIGNFNLGGRSLVGKLPHPEYKVQDQGVVVVSIDVSPEGRVIRASVKRASVGIVLRNAALDAARKARFNAVNGVDNQSGTITYYFKLK